ncbi:MAG TPA: hypothetical protein VI193_05695 [Acidimicrobiia bacterium]
MSRVLTTALLAAVVSALLLLQLQRGQELWMWELLIVFVVVWLARSLPDGGAGNERRLFETTITNPTRLPRSVSTTEMAAVDALAGSLAREQRIRPMIERIAVHRLRRRGLAIESAQAMALLGEDQWRWLTGREESLRAGELEQLVSGLERL